VIAGLQEKHTLKNKTRTKL